MVYITYLNRTAPAAEKSFWVKQVQAGATIASVIQAFVTSKEYSQVHATDTSFITAVYQDALGRKPTTTELTAAQQTVTANGRPAFVTSILTGKEFFKNVVDGYYTFYLGRAAETAGEQFWLNQLLSGGQTLEQVTQGFLSSVEYQNNRKG